MALDKYNIAGTINKHFTGIDFENPSMVAKVLGHLEGKDLQITIEPLSKKRSSKQNRYLFGVVIVCIKNYYKQQDGRTRTADEIRAFIYEHILGCKPTSKIVLGKEVWVMECKRFSKMTTVEFIESVQLVQQYFAEEGLYIPDPREYNNINDFL